MPKATRIRAQRPCTSGPTGWWQVDLAAAFHLMERHVALMLGRAVLRTGGKSFHHSFISFARSLPLSVDWCIPYLARWCVLATAFAYLSAGPPLFLTFGRVLQTLSRPFCSLLYALPSPRGSQIDHQGSSLLTAESRGSWRNCLSPCASSQSQTATLTQIH